MYSHHSPISSSLARESKADPADEKIAAINPAKSEAELLLEQLQAVKDSIQYIKNLSLARRLKCQYGTRIGLLIAFSALIPVTISLLWDDFSATDIALMVVPSESIALLCVMSSLYRCLTEALRYSNIYHEPGYNINLIDNFSADRRTVASLNEDQKSYLLQLLTAAKIPAPDEAQALFSILVALRAKQQEIEASAMYSHAVVQRNFSVFLMAKKSPSASAYGFFHHSLFDHHLLRVIDRFLTQKPGMQFNR